MNNLVAKIEKMKPFLKRFLEINILRQSVMALCPRCQWYNSQVSLC